MKKIRMLFLFLMIICSSLVMGCKKISDLGPKETNEINIFTGYLRGDYKVGYKITECPEGSGRKYVINIDPVDESYKREKQPYTVTFLSNIKIDKLRKISNEENPEENKIMIPEVGLEISDDTIKVEENFGLYCPGRDGDNFIRIPGGSGNLVTGKNIELCNDESNCRNNWVEYEAYHFMGPVQYRNHYKRGDISMFFEWNEGNGLRIDNAEVFSKNCMIEIGEIEDFLPLNLPFELNFKNFDYTTLGFIKDLSVHSDCSLSHKKFNPHHNYMSFFTEDMSCQLRYESGTTLRSITFENVKDK